MSCLQQIREAVQLRAEATTAARPDWPCRKGCDDCCRSLASVPQVTGPEWDSIAAALDTLPPPIADSVRHRIRNSVTETRPVTCPLLDPATGACLVYGARPIVCRAYGFYAEREFVLGCSRIASTAHEALDVVWGNHAALDGRLRSLGPTATLAEWLARSHAV